MKDIVKNMWNGILNEEKPKNDNKPFVVKYTNKEDEEYMAKWTAANDKKHNTKKEK
jgi:hypothetical protein